MQWPEGSTREEAKKQGNTPSTTSASSAVPTRALSKTTCEKEPRKSLRLRCSIGRPFRWPRRRAGTSLSAIRSTWSLCPPERAPARHHRHQPYWGEFPELGDVNGKLSTSEAREELSENFDTPLIRGSDAHVHVHALYRTRAPPSRRTRRPLLESACAAACGPVAPEGPEERGNQSTPPRRLGAEVGASPKAAHGTGAWE